MLQDQFTILALRYTQNAALIKQLWNEIETAYSDSERYFHTLSHLENLMKELSPLESSIQDWDTLLFCLFYHDIVYDMVQHVLENDNEEISSAIAEKTLETICFPTDKIELCRQHILATKAHRISDNADINFFIDADLSILGKPWEVYNEYTKNIRKEYHIYPDSIYHSGRLNILRHFRKMDRVFKTDHFFNLYEEKARENMTREIEILSLL